MGFLHGNSNILAMEKQGGNTNKSIEKICRILRDGQLFKASRLQGHFFSRKEKKMFRYDHEEYV